MATGESTIRKTRRVFYHIEHIGGEAKANHSDVVVNVRDGLHVAGREHPVFQLGAIN